MHRSISLALWGSLLVFFWVDGVNTFSWGDNERRPGIPLVLKKDVVNPPTKVQHRSRLSNAYTVALQELQELESEPLCHRIAARLLVNNCQLLDGKDDATVLIDSGRQIRDFVDSYAASLAICDLERGSFAIPSGCAPFKERSLASIPDSKIPRLHVSPQQIDVCLSGLAKSDSAWNTWVSYRHKALRFCEAARADNDKAQSIRLHQRLAEVLSKLSEGVEQEIESQLHVINMKATETMEQLRHMAPGIDLLRNGLQSVEKMLSHDVMQLLQASNSAMRSGVEDAQNLQQLLNILLKTVLNANAEVAASHEMMLSNVKDRTESEVAFVMAALASAATSSTSLQNQMELSHLRVVELAGRQDHLEKGLGRLLGLTEELSSKYELHTEKLTQAHRKSEDLLDTLDNMAISASEVRSSLDYGSGWKSCLPYVIFPAASLLMGSYGLPPSAVRNIGLIALGELAGFVVSYTKYFTYPTTETSQHGIPNIEEANTTLAFAAAEINILQNLPSDLRKIQPMKKV